MVELVLPGPEKELEWLRARLNEIRADANSWSKLKRSGIRSDLLDFQARTALERLIGVCAAAGLFLVPAGERESWLEPEVPYSKNKTAYIMKALEHVASGKLADNAPLSVFIRGVHAYLEVQ